MYLYGMVRYARMYMDSNRLAERGFIAYTTGKIGWWMSFYSNGVLKKLRKPNYLLELILIIITKSFAKIFGFVLVVFVDTELFLNGLV